MCCIYIMFLCHFWSGDGFSHRPKHVAGSKTDGIWLCLTVCACFLLFVYHNAMSSIKIKWFCMSVTGCCVFLARLLMSLFTVSTVCGLFSSRLIVRGNFRNVILQPGIFCGTGNTLSGVGLQYLVMRRLWYARLLATELQTKGVPLVYLRRELRNSLSLLTSLSSTSVLLLNRSR